MLNNLYKHITKNKLKYLCILIEVIESFKLNMFILYIT